MPLYQYKCRACGGTVDKFLHHDDPTRNLPLPCRCQPGAELRRVFSLAFTPVLHNHFNAAVGKEVSSMRGFKDDLKRASERQEAATGNPTNYVPLSPAEMKDARSLGVTDEGMKATHDAQVAQGIKDPSTKYL